MTPTEQQAEWHYRYQERLSLLCGTADPTPEEKALAWAEADKAIKELRLAEAREYYRTRAKPPLRAG